jgi:hypothetical protein
MPIDDEVPSGRSTVRLRTPQIQRMLWAAGTTARVFDHQDMLGAPVGDEQAANLSTLLRLIGYCGKTAGVMKELLAGKPMFKGEIQRTLNRNEDTVWEIMRATLDDAEVGDLVAGADRVGLALEKGKPLADGSYYSRAVPPELDNRHVSASVRDLLEMVSTTSRCIDELDHLPSVTGSRSDAMANNAAAVIELLFIAGLDAADAAKEYFRDHPDSKRQIVDATRCHRDLFNDAIREIPLESHKLVEGIRRIGIEVGGKSAADHR